MIQSLSSTIIDQRKDESINAQSLRKTVAFRELNLIDEKTIEYQGKRIAIT
jgi:chemotaxis methyl-accepting protein methylase